MTTIGELLVSITGSETGLTTAINNSEKSIKKLGTTTETTAKGSGFQSIFQGVGLGVGLFALNAIQSGISDVTGAISSSIGIAEADQVALTKLTQAMQDAGVAGDGMDTSLVNARNAGVDLGFTIQDLTNAQALLVTGTKSVSNANVALTAAEDLARLKGIDLGTAVTAVNKLFNGSATAITRMGIAIPKGAKGLEAIADLEKAAGGQADAFAGTTAGAMDRASASIDKLEGDIGNALLPILGSAADALSNVLDLSSDIQTQTASNTASLASLIQTGTTDQMKSAAAAIQTGIDQLNSAFRIHIGPLDTNSGVDPAVAGLKAQLQQVDAALAYGVASTTDRGAEINRAVSSIGPAVHDAVQAAGTAAANFPAYLETPLQQAHDAIVALMGKTPQDLVNALQSGYSNISNEASSLADALKHPMTLAAREAQLNGELHDKNLVAGLKSKDPLVKAQAEALRDSIEAQMQQLEADAPGYGLQTIKGYADALGGAQALADVKRAAKAAVGAAKGIMAAFSPPGPESPLHDIDKWGFNTGSAWADGLAMGLGTADPSGALSGIGIPGAAGSGAMGAVGSPLSGATIVVQVGNEKLAEITDRPALPAGPHLRPGIPSQTLGAPTR